MFTLDVLLRLDNIVSNEKVADNIESLAYFDQSLKENEKHIAPDEKVTSYFLLGFSYFLSGDLRKALRRVNQAISLSKTVRKDLHHLSLMLELCIHFCLENTDLLETKLNSYRKSLTKSEPFFTFESDTFKFLKKIIQSPNNPKFISDFNKFILSELQKSNKMEYKNMIAFRYLKAY